jgi:F0F1-type ATP synthase membrane subunit b/b'
VQLGSFLLFVALFNRIMIQPLRRVMNERGAFIEKVAQEVSAADRQFQEISSRVEEQEAEARATAGKIHIELIHSGQMKAEEVLAATRQSIAAARTAAQQEMDRQFDAAREDLHRQADIIAERMIDTVLGRRSVI